MKMWPIFVGTVQPHIFGGDQVKLTPCAKEIQQRKTNKTSNRQKNILEICLDEIPTLALLITQSQKYH